MKPGGMASGCMVSRDATLFGLAKNSRGGRGRGVIKKRQSQNPAGLVVNGLREGIELQILPARPSPADGLFFAMVD